MNKWINAGTIYSFFSFPLINEQKKNSLFFIGLESTHQKYTLFSTQYTAINKR